MPLNYSRWKHRITFSLSPITTVADRWVSLTLPWRPGLRADFADLRFSDTAGSVLDYNIASKTDGVTVSVKINIPTAGTRLIFCYFGNSQAVSESISAGTEDTNPTLTAVSGTTNPGYSGSWLLIQGGRLSQQGYTRGIPTGPYPEWKHQDLIKITDPVSQTEYQHKIILPWHPGMKPDFDDIRFAQLDGQQCPYWIESYTAKSSATAFIKVPKANQRYLYLYYGNGTAESESDGGAVFEFFDDFSGSSFDTAKWTYKTGSATVSGGILTFEATSRYVRQGIKSGDTFSPGTAIIVRYREMSNGIYHQTWVGFTNWSTDYVHIRSHDSEQEHGEVSNGTLSSTYLGDRDGSYDRFEIQWISSSLCKFRKNNGSFSSITTNIPTSSVPVSVSAHRGSASGTEGAYVDYIAVRSIVSVEPTLEVVSHRPNDYRIIPFETITYPGETYVLDTVEFGATYTGENGPTILKPEIEFDTEYIPSPPTTVLKPLIEFDARYTGSAILKEYIALDLLPVKNVSVSKSVDDQYLSLNATLVGYHELNLSTLKHVTYVTKDHENNDVAIFSGVLPKSSITIQECANQTTLSGVDYAWYLNNQYVPEDWQHNTKTVNPADIITGILGGDDWQETTGILPYQIDQVIEWGDTLNSKVFDFEVTTTKTAAIKKICRYTRYIFLVKLRFIDGVATPCAYFISESNLDSRADLPDPLTIINPDDYLDGKIKIEIKGDERYNRVTVIGRNNAGGKYSCTLESDAVSNGDELPVEYTENSGSWTTQDQVNARCQELFTYYVVPANTYSVTFLERMDIELLQKIRFTGYNEVSDNWMRITKIAKSISGRNDGVEKKVKITFTNDSKWRSTQSMYRSSDDDMSNEMETIASSIVTSLGTTQVGVVDSIDGTEVTVLLEDGTTQTVRGTT